MPHFVQADEPPEPHDAEEATNWELFMQTLAALLSTWGITKKEEEEIQEIIAEELEIPTPAPLPKKSRIEELAFAMELVETHNQDPKTMGVRFNNPGCLKFSNWQKEYGAVRGSGDFTKFSTYAQGKTAQLRLLRSACSGRMPAYKANGTIKQFIYQYANSSPEIEKANYVRRVCIDLGISPATILKTLL